MRMERRQEGVQQHIAAEVHFGRECARPLAATLSRLSCSLPCSFPSIRSSFCLTHSQRHLFGSLQ